MPQCPDCKSDLTDAQFALGNCPSCNASLKTTEGPESAEGVIDLGTTRCPTCGELVEVPATRCTSCGQALTTDRPRPPDSGLGPAILVTLFCCWPIGLIAIFTALQVNRVYRSGDYKRAQRLAQRSQKLTTWAIIGGVVVVVAYLCFPGRLQPRELSGPVGVSENTSPQVRVVRFDNDEVYYSGDASQEDARKLGEFLKKAMVFRNDGATVRLVAASGSYEVSLVLIAGAWDEPGAVEYFRELGRRMSAVLFSPPLTVHLCDQFMSPRKTIVIR